MKIEQTSPRPARPRTGPPAQRSSKAVKIGRSSFMVSETAHRNLIRLSSYLDNSMQGAIRHLCEKYAGIVADIQFVAVQKVAESLGWESEPPEMIELRQQYCRASSLDEMAARMSAEYYGLELLQQGGWRRFDEGRSEQQAEIRDIRAVAR